jgi:hypothetical protein
MQTTFEKRCLFILFCFAAPYLISLPGYAIQRQPADARHLAGEEDLSKMGEVLFSLW